MDMNIPSGLMCSIFNEARFDVYLGYGLCWFYEMQATLSSFVLSAMFHKRMDGQRFPRITKPVLRFSLLIGNAYRVFSG